jgi:sugar phosphate permease
VLLDPGGDGEPRSAGVARYQPRDERGRFVAYWVLSHEIQTDLSDAGGHYADEEDTWIAAWPDTA